MSTGLVSYIRWTVFASCLTRMTAAAAGFCPIMDQGSLIRQQRCPRCLSGRCEQPYIPAASSAILMDT